MRFGQEEINAVTEVIKSGELSTFYANPYGGKKVREFEKSFAKYHEVKHAIATSSGTSALHTALLACKIGCGDEVITTPLTFVATASTILMTGAKPIFVDVDPKTYNIDPNEINEAITPKTKAIIPVHLLGHPCEIETIMEIAKDEKLYVIEDCAQSLGAKYNGKLTGTFGDLAIFSFQETKTITTLGEGGMIITNSDKLAEKCKMIRNHAEKYFNANLLGYNYRLTEAQAAFGIEQLKKLDRFNEINIENAKKVISNLPKEIIPPKVSEKVKHVFFIIGCLFIEKEKPREKVIEHLQREGVIKKKPGFNVGVGYDKLLYDLPLFKPYKRECTVAESLLKRFFWIDFHRWKTDEELRYYMLKLREALEK